MTDALDVDLKKRDSICVSATKIFVSRVEGQNIVDKWTASAASHEFACKFPVNVRFGFVEEVWAYCPTSADPKVKIIYWTVKRIKGGCEFGVLLYLFTQLLNVFLQDVFYNVIRKTNGRGKRFYDRELPLPTWRTMVVCPFSLRWWSQLWRSLLLLFFWRLSTPCFLSIDIVITTIKMK